MKNFLTHLASPLFFEHVCQHFSLGTFLQSEEISNGLLHHVWRIQTTQGEFAVKLLNSAIKKLQGHKILGYDQSQHIAAQMQKRGIPAVGAIPVKVNSRLSYLLNTDSGRIMVHPWVNGRNDISITNLHAAAIGRLLGQIHNLQLSAAQFASPLWGVYSSAQWRRLLHEISQAQIPELTFLAEKLDWLVDLSAEAQQAFTLLNSNLILSHRDLNPKNILWQDNAAPWLIDWEYAGPINPQLERFIVACNWSNITTQNPNKNLFQEVMAGYASEVQSTAKIFPEKTVLAGYAGYVLDWIIFNCRRAINMPLQRPSSIEEVRGSLRALDNADAF
ncbi:MAG TPA: phosphotransferase [Gammaproteobacteria bacterium]|nr:phosphotransferase [Gammaproteobacteria bacterium]